MADGEEYTTMCGTYHQTCHMSDPVLRLQLIKMPLLALSEICAFLEGGVVTSSVLRGAATRLNISR